MPPQDAKAEREKNSQEWTLSPLLLTVSCTPVASSEHGCFPPPRIGGWIAQELERAGYLRARQKGELMHILFLLTPNVWWSGGQNKETSTNSCNAKEQGKGVWGPKGVLTDTAQAPGCSCSLNTRCLSGPLRSISDSCEREVVASS